VELIAAVSDTCFVCDLNDDNPKLCEKIKKFAEDIEKTRENFEVQLERISKDNRIFQGNVDSMDSKITQHASETEYNVKIKEAKFEKKFNDNMGELKRQLEELKKNSAANVFSCKVHALVVVALMFFNNM
jgi:peptide subunit release factor RF-3